MKKKSTTLGQYFKNLVSQVMRSDSTSGSNIASDEKPSLKNRLAKHLVAGAAALAIAGSANAAIVNWNCNLVPAVDIDGMYINVETQVGSNGPGTGVPGWDLNPYTTNGGANWFNSTGGGQMRYPGVTTGPAGNLAIGTTVGATGSWNTATTSTVIGTAPGNWQLNATNYLGFRFVSAAGTVHYGWAKINVGAVQTARTIVQIAYESVAATPINVGDAGSCTAPTLSATTVAALCAGNANGSIDLTATNGSPAPTFAWSGPNSFTATTEDLSALAAGSYTVIATSGTCTSTATYTVVAGAQPTIPTLACYQTANFNSSTCVWDVTGAQPTQPTLACYQTANFNSSTCVWDVTGSQPSMPTLACYETASFNSSTCVWDVTGAQPSMPSLACYETASFNTSTCVWEVTGTQPAVPTSQTIPNQNYYNLSAFTTAAVYKGYTISAPATFEAYSGFYASGLSGNFSAGSPTWTASATGGLYVDAAGGSQVLSSNQPVPLTLTFNPGVTGLGANIFITDINFGILPGTITVTFANGATTSFSTTSANDFFGTTANSALITSISISSTSTTTGYVTVDNLVIATGTLNPSSNVSQSDLSNFTTAAVTAGYTISATETFNSYNGLYGSPLSGNFGAGTPTWAASATGGLYFDAAGGSQVLSSNQPVPLTLTFNPGVTGLGANIFITDASFNVIPGTITATFSNGNTNSFSTTSATDFFSATAYSTLITSISISSTSATTGYVTVDNLVIATGTIGSTLACYQSYVFNNNTCAWDVTGTQPSMPTLACYQTANFNTTSCAWDVTGSQPTMPTLACYETASFNTTSCAWDVTGTQPSLPSLACYETAILNSTTCSWDVTGSQPSMPTLACYETANFNTGSCQWDVTGTQPSMPSLACYETATFNSSTCVWDVTGAQPSMPSLACYETASFNSSTCVWDVTGSQPTQPTLACYESANFNTGTCQWDVTGTQPSMPSLACYETATFNSSTCVWDVTGSPAAAIVTTTTGCDSYVWSANGTTYTQSGTYNYSANCQDYTLNLTINNSTLYYADVDGDGYGNASSTTTSCNGAPTGYVAQAGDCNDNNSSIYPGATEVCGNGIDDNCDGSIDEGTSVTANPIVGNLQICNLYANAKTLTTATLADAISYNWTVPSDMTITSGQGTNSIVVSWGNINLLQNGIIGNVTVTPVLSTSGCVTVVPASIPVDLQYTAPVTPPSISGPSAICPNESGVYSIALVKRASSYEWSVPTGASITNGAGSNIINVSYANGFAGGNVTVGAKNVCGLSTPLRTRNVTLNVLPAPASITGPVDGLCNASNANYLASSVVGATGYNWTVPANASINSGSNSNNISANFNSSFTTGNITVAAVNNCGVGATRSLAVKAAPAIPGTITGPASACTGSTQSYAISTVQGASNYIWTVPGGAVINSGQGTKNLNLNFGSVASANGIITVKSSNSCGTSTAKVLAVVTSVCPRLGDAVTQLQVYPNPANSYINVSFNVEQSQKATIILRDAAGRIVYNEAIDAATGLNSQQIELSNFSKGVYFVQLQTTSSSENTRLIVD